MRKQTVYFKNTSKKLASFFLVTAVSFTSLQPAFASRKTQAQDAKQQAENNLNSVNNNINSIANKQQELQKEINALDAELVDLLVNMDILADELADLLWVTMAIANQTGVDLTDALRANIDKKTSRDADRHKNNPKLRTS